MVRPDLVLRQESGQDLQEAQRWYEDQSAGLGNEFVAEVDAAFSRVREDPESFPKVLRDYRPISMRRFPYQLFFKFEFRQVVIYAVTHMKRRPSVWRRRLK